MNDFIDSCFSWSTIWLFTLCLDPYVLSVHQRSTGLQGCCWWHALWMLRSQYDKCLKPFHSLFCINTSRNRYVLIPLCINWLKCWLFCVNCHLIRLALTAVIVAGYENSSLAAVKVCFNAQQKHGWVVEILLKLRIHVYRTETPSIYAKCAIFIDQNRMLDCVTTWFRELYGLSSGRFGVVQWRLPLRLGLSQTSAGLMTAHWRVHGVENNSLACSMAFVIVAPE